MYKVLIVEDKPEECIKADEAARRAGFAVHVVEDMHEALLALGEIEEASYIAKGSRRSSAPEINGVKWDGVITDLHFPVMMGINKPEPNGIELCIRLKEKGIPTVICTDVFHHSAEWAVRICRLIGANYIDNKDWSEACRKLAQKMEAKNA